MGKFPIKVGGWLRSKIQKNITLFLNVNKVIKYINKRSFRKWSTTKH